MASIETTFEVSEDENHVSWLSSQLNHQRKDGEFCDVLLLVSGQVFPTHSCVLSACSSYFRHKIVSVRPRHSSTYLVPDGKPQQIVLDVPGLLPAGMQDEMLEAVSGLLEYVYTGKIQLKEESVEIVMKLAEAIDFEGLATLVRSCKRKTSKRRTHNSKPMTVSQKRVAKQSATARPNGLAKKRKSSVALSAENEDPPARTLRTRRPGPSTSSPLSDDDAGDVSNDTIGSTDRVIEIGAPSEAKKSYKFNCNQCKFFSRDLAAIRLHHLFHPSRIYSCVSCNFISGRCITLLDHLLEADHSEETMCSLCDHRAVDSTAYRVHLQRHCEDRARPYYCEHCDQRFKTPSTLGQHAIKHTSDRPFVCSGCADSFKSKSHLNRHQLLVHKKAKLYLCSECGFKTAYKPSLRIHERSHSGSFLHCSHPGCSYQTIYESSLRVHQSTHAAVKQQPHQCEVCGQKFTMKQSLLRHAKLHDTAAERFSCQFCSYSTTRNDKLVLHNKTHVGGHKLEQKNSLEFRTSLQDTTAKRHNCQLCPYSTTRRNKLLLHTKSHVLALDQLVGFSGI